MEGTSTWTQLLILGDGRLGRAVETAARERGDEPRGRTRVRVLGRPATGRHDPADLAGADLVVEASRGDRGRARTWRPRSTPAAAASSSPRPAGPPIAPRVEALLREHGAAAVAASNFSLGVVLFGRLVEAAVGLFGPLEAFDPYLLEWHRRSKRDRPSGTATDLAAADRRRPSAPRRRRTTSRSSRSGRARRRACTWSASMPPARRSSCG